MAVVEGVSIVSDSSNSKSWFLRHKVLSGVAVVAVIAIIGGVASGAGSKSPNKGGTSTTTATTQTTATTAASTTSAAPPNTDTTGSFSYCVTTNGITSDTATKTVTISVWVRNGGAVAAAPWCTADVESSPGNDLGIAAPEKFPAIAPGASTTETVKVKLALSGTARDPQSLCATSRSAAANSVSWYDATIAVSPTTTTTVPAQVAATCNDARTVSEDINIWRATGTEPAKTFSDFKALSTAAFAPGGNAKLASETNGVGNALKTGKLLAVHAALEKVDDTCLSLSP